MNYVGVDIHKKYSVLVAVDGRGRELVPVDPMLD